MNPQPDLKKVLGAESLRRAKIAVIGAHPDDETIGAGSRLMHCPGAFIITATDGSPQNISDALAAGFKTAEQYRIARSVEQNRVNRLLALPNSRLVRLNFGDQELAKNLRELVDRLTNALKTISPDLILTHPYEGGHPDHDSVAFATHICRELAENRKENFPPVVEFSSYHAYLGKRRIGHFLDQPKSHPVIEFWLSEKESALKRKMLDAYISQKQNLEGFETKVERFRHAPTYDFTRSPSAEPLYYDSQPWGMTGSKWREYAKKALGNLGIALAA